VHENEPRPFAGYKFLIIEDEMIQAWRVGDMLAMLGGTVDKIAFSYDQGMSALIEDARWDCAIVDINLHGEMAFPLVAILQQKGIPFIYCSAYVDTFSNTHPDVAAAVCLGKPVTIKRLRDAVLLVLKARQL
jgi:two-component SAPR family response regulator